MTNLDLSALRLDPAPAAPSRRPWGPRLLAAGAGVLVLAVVLSFAWPLLRPVRAVPCAAIRAATAAGDTTATSVAEAVGWVEADPFPVIVRPLVAGRIAQIQVLEGATVTAGETVIAALESAGLQAAHERAAAVVAEREAAVAAAAVAHEQAGARRAQNAERRLAVAAARIRVAEADTALAAATGMRERTAAEAIGAAAALRAQEQLQAAGTSNAVALERTRAAAAAAAAAAVAAVAEATAAAATRSAALAALQTAEELAADPVDLEWAVRSTRAELDKVQQDLAVAQVELQIAARERQWAREVVAPVDGVVLRLLATPGAATGPEGEGIVSLYDRHRLRARIDVPLGSVGNIAAGQPVELRSEVTGSTVVRGVVQRLQHESDLLKNTLQVKIELIDPPDLWRPETLCRARFLGAGPSPGAATEHVFLVPRAAVRGDAVFVLDPAQRRARRIEVAVVGTQGDESAVRGELSVTQRVILAEVTDGERVEELQR